jgi:putative DNA primase/helicase
MESDADMRDYLQRCAGYWSSPFTIEQAFWFCYGSGGNGKGAFLRTIKRVLGTYAATASLDLFLATKFEPHPEELAALRGVRFLMATETEEGRRWNEAKIKAMTGGDSVRARFMRQNSFEYDPQFKIVVSGNAQPAVKTVDPAMRRRLQLVPFVVEITEAERSDGDFEPRLIRDEGGAILAWMLDGFEEWRKHRLSPPDKVITASAEYFEEQDTLAQWVEECCELCDAAVFTYTSVLFQSYAKFCQNANERPGTQNGFGRKLANKKLDGVVLHHKNNGNGFFGLRLKPAEYNE